MKAAKRTIERDDPLFLDIVSRVAVALVPLKPRITAETVSTLDAFARAVMETIDKEEASPMTDDAMKITLEATGTIDTVQGKVQARIWEGQTESGVPIKAWIAVLQPQTHDLDKLAEFERELKEVLIVSFDMRML